METIKEESSHSITLRRGRFEKNEKQEDDKRNSGNCGTVGAGRCSGRIRSQGGV